MSKFFIYFLDLCNCGCGNIIYGNNKYKIGHNRPMLNKKDSIETKKKKSLAKLGISKSEEHKEKLRIARLGQKHTIETIENMKKYRTGKNNSNWKEGITPLNKQIRSSLNMKLWIINIFKRDNFTCQKCKNKGVILRSHHIKTFASIIKQYNIKTLEEALLCNELWNLENGITYCESCHEKLKKKGGKL
jgi:hypothetical protein